MEGDQKNLLRETIAEIARAKRTTAEIVFIGSPWTGHSCTWDEFTRLADIEYNSGYGGAEVAGDLRVVFNDGGFMAREEYDGSEWWAYHGPALNLPTERKPIHTLVRGTSYRDSLADINEVAPHD